MLFIYTTKVEEAQALSSNYYIYSNYMSPLLGATTLMVAQNPGMKQGVNRLIAIR